MNLGDTIKVGQIIYTKEFDKKTGWYIHKAKITKIDKYTITIESIVEIDGVYPVATLARYSTTFWNTDIDKLQKVVDKDNNKL